MKRSIITIILCFMPLICFAQEAKTQNFYEKPSEKFIGLRNQVFSASPKSTGIEVGSTVEPWGVVMETGLPEAVATLVSLKDGTASLYFSNGSGIIGGGEHKSVSDIAKSLVTISKDFISSMNKTVDYPLPDTDKVRFYILTASGVFASKLIDAKDLREGNDRLSGLFYLGYEVITALRKIEEKR